MSLLKKIFPREKSKKHYFANSYVTYFSGSIPAVILDLVSGVPGITSGINRLIALGTTLSFGSVERSIREGTRAVTKTDENKTSLKQQREVDGISYVFTSSLSIVGGLAISYLISYLAGEEQRQFVDILKETALASGLRIGASVAIGRYKRDLEEMVYALKDLYSENKRFQYIRELPANTRRRAFSLATAGAIAITAGVPFLPRLHIFDQPQKQYEIKADTTSNYSSLDEFVTYQNL